MKSIHEATTRKQSELDIALEDVNRPYRELWPTIYGNILYGNAATTTITTIGTATYHYNYFYDAFRHEPRT